MRKANF